MSDQQKTEIVEAEKPTVVPPPEHNPFARALSADAAPGAVEIEMGRAVAEAQGALVIAQKFPRDEAEAYKRMLAGCGRMGLAEEAFWKFSRAGETITGPSIRLAEFLAGVWGNITYGMRELSHRDGKTEMEVFAWDLQTNVRSVQQFVVLHERDTKSGTKKLESQRDIYELGANLGARRMRSAILRVLPADFVDHAEKACRKTLEVKGANEPMESRIKRMLLAFAGYGVEVKRVEEHLGHPTDAITLDELMDLQAIYNSIRGGAKVEGFFPREKPQVAAPRTTATAAPATPAPAATPTAVPPPAAPRRGRPPKNREAGPAPADATGAAISSAVASPAPAAPPIIDEGPGETDAEAIERAAQPPPAPAAPAAQDDMEDLFT